MSSFSPKRIVKVWTKNNWGHTLKELTAHWLRNTGIEACVNTKKRDYGGQKLFKKYVTSFMDDPVVNE